jgi:hypothetical protein
MAFQVPSPWNCSVTFSMGQCGVTFERRLKEKFRRYRSLHRLRGTGSASSRSILA